MVGRGSNLSYWLLACEASLAHFEDLLQVVNQLCDAVRIKDLVLDVQPCIAIVVDPNGHARTISRRPELPKHAIVPDLIRELFKLLSSLAQITFAEVHIPDIQPDAPIGPARAHFNLCALAFGPDSTGDISHGVVPSFG